MVGALTDFSKVVRGGAQAFTYRTANMMSRANFLLDGVLRGAFVLAVDRLNGGMCMWACVSVDYPKFQCPKSLVRKSWNCVMIDAPPGNFRSW